MRLRLPAIALTTLLLGACASLPETPLRYYLPTWQAEVEVSRTIYCERTADKRLMNPILGPILAPLVTPTFFSDRNAQVEVPLTDLHRWFANQDLEFKLTEDGRLKSVNREATGTGEAIVKSFVEVVSGLRTAVTQTMVPQGTAEPSNACAIIEKLVGSESNSMTVAWRTSIDAAGKVGELRVDPPFANARLPQPVISVKLEPLVQSGAPQSGAADAAYSLKLRGMKLASVTISDPDGGGHSSTHVFVVPAGEPTYVPIPKAPFFGKTVFELELADSGAITRIKYGSESGAAGAIGAVGEAAKLRSTQATETQRLTAQADLLAARARLEKCIKTPDACE